MQASVTSLAKTNALILAGNRGGSDAIASLTGVSHKAMAPINGTPMILRLWRCLSSCPDIDRIYVCMDAAEQLDAVDELARGRQSGRLIVIPPAASPAASVVAALAEIGLGQPLLITTADHPLLTPDIVNYFLAQVPQEADFAIALAELETIHSAYPESVRTGYRLANKSYSGCNLFMARRPEAARIATFWQRMERFRKKPWRLVLEIGPWALIRFFRGSLDLNAAVDHLSRRTNTVIRSIIMPYAEAAIDVDKAVDYVLATSILQRREGVIK